MSISDLRDLIQVRFYDNNGSEIGWIRLETVQAGFELINYLFYFIAEIWLKIRCRLSPFLTYFSGYDKVRKNGVYKVRHILEAFEK